MLTNDLEVAVSGELIDYVPVPDPPIQIYLARAELSNAGIVERSIGLVNTIGANKLCTAADAPTTTGGTAPADSQCVFPFTWDGVTYDACTTVDNGGSRLGWCKIAGDVLWGNCKCDGAEVEIKNDPGDLDTTHRIVALGTGAYAQLVDAGIDPAFQCGDDQVRPPLPRHPRAAFAPWPSPRTRTSARCSTSAKRSTRRACRQRLKSTPRSSRRQARFPDSRARRVEPTIRTTVGSGTRISRRATRRGSTECALAPRNLRLHLLVGVVSAPCDRRHARI